MPQRPCITLTTDFGRTGPYVGALKGAILRVNPSALIIDITHDIPRGDIVEASFTLACAFRSFPDESIHLSVVDPGVGSDRKGVIISTEKHYFVGPDNGLFTHATAREEIYNIIHIIEDQYFHNPPSPTFHGRDIFAPVAGWLSKGFDCARFGEPLEDFQRLPRPEPTEIRPKAWKGCIQNVDHFGNLVTNFTEEQIPLDETGLPSIIKALTPRGDITRFHRFYAEAPAGDPCILLGSFGFYEIAINGGSAAETLNLKRGSEIAVLAR